MTIIADVIIDFHTHIFPPEIKRNRAEYLKHDPGFALLYSNPKHRLATMEDLICSMDRNGIDVSVVFGFGWSSHEMCVEANDYVIDAMQRYPNRLVGLCVIQPRAGEAALQEIDRCARAGVRGIGELQPDLQGFRFNDEVLLRPIVERAQRYGIILLTHTSEPVGHFYAGKGATTPQVIHEFAHTFPQINLICAHWGGGLPFYFLMPEVARTLQNVYFDTSASNFLYRPQIFKHVAEIAGPERILFGSDFPLIDQNKLIAQIDTLNLPEETKNRILGGNARHLLREVAGSHVPQADGRS